MSQTLPPPDHHDPLQRLLAIMERLRDPQSGCPWDIEQTYASIVPHTIEEAYEVAEAVERGDMNALRDELGDLLLQVVYHSQMAREDGRFDFSDVAAAIGDKLVRRHPHVFGDLDVPDAAAQTVQWEEQKARERKAKAGSSLHSALDGLTSTLPAMTRALKLQNRAARVGFDWPEIKQVVEKIDEELAEVRAELDHITPDDGRLKSEIGDLLFTVVNLARVVGTDPEAALRHTNRKFERRFRYMEQRLAEQGKTTGDVCLEEMESLWCEAKTTDEP
ncbi:MAG: nucleoside triphosphate pyrophosphohydrolase [Rhodospirillaceae bacterium]